MPDWRWPDFDWDEFNVEQLFDRHGIDPRQVEQMFFTGPHVERVGDFYHAYGQDDAGQYLFVVFVFRTGEVRAITARFMSARERRFYERHR